jgi:NAD-dependent DNA ligase
MLRKPIRPVRKLIAPHPAPRKGTNSDDMIAQLRRHDKLYARGEAVISDEEYDALREQAHRLAPRHAYFRSTGEPLPEDSKLPALMPGLTKIRPVSAESWAGDSGWLYWSEKIDGISCLLHYRDGELLRAYKKSSETHGREITDAVKRVNHVPLMLTPIGVQTTTPATTRGDILVRGELAVKYSVFDKYSYERLGDKGYKHPRAMVASIFLPAKPVRELLTTVDFVAYSIVFPEPFSPEYERQQLATYFPNVAWGSQDSVSPELEASLTDAIKDVKQSKVYPCDGIVAVKQEGGEIARVAIKLHTDDQLSKKTIVKRIEIDMSMRNLAKPRVIIEPVEIDGVVISSITANNMREIDKFRLGPGSIVHVVRAGDVIPHILKSEEFAPTPSKQYKQLVTCPDCGHSLHWSMTASGKQGADLACSYVPCKESKRTEVFLERSGVKGLGDVQIAALSKNNSVRDILELPVKDVGDILGSQIVAQKICDALDTVLECPLTRVMYMSGIFTSQTVSLGETTLASILSILEANEIREKDITDSYRGASQPRMAGVLPPTEAARLFVERIHDFRVFYASIADWHRPPERSSELQGMTFCFTGFRDPELSDALRARGAAYSDSLSKKTTHLVYKTSPHQTKLDKASQYGCKVISLDVLHEMLRTV